MDTMWAKYVIHLVGDEHWKVTRDRGGVSQGTISRWRNSELLPDKAAVVAYFARAYGRNPLEAFVAAGMLTMDEARTAIDPESVLLLETLAGKRRGRSLRSAGTSKRSVSEPADRPDLEVAADEQEQSISGEQVEPTEP